MITNDRCVLVPAYQGYSVMRAIKLICYSSSDFASAQCHQFSIALIEQFGDCGSLALGQYSM